MTKEMKIDADRLAAEVTWLSRIPTNGSPSSAVIEITTMLGAIVLRRSDLEQYREVLLPAEGTGQATLLVDAGKLTAGLKALSGIVTIAFSDDTLALSASTKTVRIKAAALEFPKWPKFEPATEKSIISGQDLAAALSSAGTDPTMPQLMVASFDRGRIVTTDRFRLTAITYGESDLVGQVPAVALKAFAKPGVMARIRAGRCYGESADWLQISDEVRTLTIAMVDSQFPQWERLVPEKPPLRIGVRRNDLLKAVRGESVKITMSLEGEFLTVVSLDDGVEVEQTVEITHLLRNDTTEPLEVVLRSKFVTDCLKSIDSGLVIIEGDTSGPVVFKDLTEKALYLIMPTRIPEAEPAAVGAG